MNYGIHGGGRFESFDAEHAFDWMKQGSGSGWGPQMHAMTGGAARGSWKNGGIVPIFFFKLVYQSVASMEVSCNYSHVQGTFF